MNGVTMDFGFGVPTRGPLATPRDIATIASRGEALGFRTVVVNDHIIVPRDVDSTYPYSQTGQWAGGRTGEALEQLVLLSYLAHATAHLRLLTSVMVVPHRNPVVTAKMLATVDVLSEGRVTVGCGAGWMREEFDAIGTPPFKDRGRVTDEYLNVFKVLWTQGEPNFAGEYANFKNITFLPKPVQKPHPPLWIGGEGGVAMRRVAALGDGWYPIGNNPRQPLDVPDRYAAAVEKLRRYVESQGRDMAEIDLAYGVNWYSGYGDSTAVPSSEGGRRAFTGDKDEIADDIAKYHELGLRCLVLNFEGSSVSETLERMEHFMSDIVPKAGF